MPLEELNLDETAPKSLVQTNETSEDDFEVVVEDTPETPEEIIEDDTAEDEGFEDLEDTLEDDEEEVLEDDDVEDDEEEDDEDDSPEETRENHRIRSLVEEKNRERQARLAEQKRNYELQKQMIEFQKKTVESNKATLNNHIKSLKSQMVTANESGDTASYVDLQSELNRAQLDLAAIESWKPDELPEEPKDVQETSNTKSEATEEWLSENSWFQNPQTSEEIQKQKEAIAYSQILASEGYSMDSPVFFEKINSRLEKLGLAKAPKNSVKSKTKNKSSSKRRKKTKISQTVQGTSRPSAASKTRQSNNNKVVLTTEQQNIARVMGMTNKEYAAEMLRIENSKKKGQRMTTLDV